MDVEELRRRIVDFINAHPDFCDDFTRAIPGNNEKKGSEAGDCRTRRRTQAG